MELLIFPDIGATKRSRNFAEVLDVPLAIVEKRRTLDGDWTSALNVIGEVAGHNAIIFDDEIDPAGKIS
jgi:ribose-phosphate pyrophosphokinase